MVSKITPINSRAQGEPPEDHSCAEQFTEVFEGLADAIHVLNCAHIALQSSDFVDSDNVGSVACRVIGHSWRNLVRMHEKLDSWYVLSTHTSKEMSHG